MVPILLLHRTTSRMITQRHSSRNFVGGHHLDPSPLISMRIWNAPPGSNNNRLVKSTTLVRYVGKVIKYFRSVDPTHPDWKDKSMEEVPDWWTALRPLFQKEAKSFEFLYDGDGVFETNEIKPL